MLFSRDNPEGFPDLMEPVLKLFRIMCHWTWSGQQGGRSTHRATHQNALQQPCLEAAGGNSCSSRGVIYQHFIWGCKCTELLAAFQDL